MSVVLRLATTVAGLSLSLAPAYAGSPFRDITLAAGIEFVHESAPEKKYIVESMSGGLALLDFDGDGQLDIYFVNSLTVDTATQPETAASALYRNRGDGTFEEVARRAGVAFPGWGMGACVADLDGANGPDLYVTGFGINRFYRNRGDGTFDEQASALGIGGGGWSTGCGFADYDRDGDLDLFVSRYVKLDLADLPRFGEGRTCRYRGIAVQCGPRGLPGSSDLLYRNDGERFTEVGEEAGVGDPDGYFGLGVAWFDFDRDGWLDLFVANDATPNLLYQNQRDGTFKEVAFPLGVAVSEDGAEQGGMGVAVGHYADELGPSLYVTNFAEEYNALYLNRGDYFSDVSFASGTAPSSLPYVGWGTAFFDYDNDGRLDLIVVNGHVYPQLDDAKLGASAPYRQRKLLYRNVGEGRFEDVTEIGPLREARVARGLTQGDLDDDGRLDLVINDLDGAAQVLRNELSGSGNWLQVRLSGRGHNREALGAVVTVRAEGRSQMRVVRSGTGYLSQDDLRQHFGVAGAKTVDLVRIAWPDGAISQLTGLTANRRIVAVQRAKARRP